MQSIERYGVVALVFLVVTVLAVLMWGSGGDDPTEIVRTGKDKQLTEARFLTPEDRKNRKNSWLTQEEEPRVDDGAVVSLTTKPKALRRDRARPSQTEPDVESRNSIFEEMDAVADSVEVASWAPDVELQRPGASLATPELTPTSGRADNGRSFRGELKELSDKEIYTVQRGDTLGEIAQAQLGTSSLWEEILDANPGLDPARLTIGMRLKMPAPVPPQPAKGSAKTPEVEAETRGEGGRFYTVQAGDTLSEIAQRELGTWKRWKEILTANPGLSEAKLVVGKRIRLPGGPAGGADPTATVASATPSASASPRYRIQRGDSLWSIAETHLGAGSRWQEIVALNPGLDPKDMEVGRILALPEATRSVSSRSMNEKIVSRASSGSEKRRVR